MLKNKRNYIRLDCWIAAVWRWEFTTASYWYSFNGRLSISGSQYSCAGTREKPSTLDDALSLARELESLRLLDRNNALRKADTKVRSLETEQTQLKTEVDGLKHKLEEQQHKLEAQANIIGQLHQPQGPPRGGWECWICGESGHLKKQCPRYRARMESTQPLGNGRRVSPRAREGKTRPNPP